jgi:DNA-binding transcriptional LysR family regulator
MLFRQLEYFMAAAGEKHSARAAEACYVSPPTLAGREMATLKGAQRS